MAHGPIGAQLWADDTWETFRTTWFGPSGIERLAVLLRPAPAVSDEDAFRDMLFDEIKILRNLEHPNVERLLESGSTDGVPWLLFDDVEGRTLEDVMRTAREKSIAIPLPLATWIVSRVASGLAYAHGFTLHGNEPLGIVHRDVSPRHIHLGWDGSVRLGGFALARPASRIMSTRAGIIKGRFSYMSPEQVTGHPLTPLSDAFSCGAILYELATGTQPFRGESSFGVLEAIRTCQPEPPETHPYIAKAIDRCLCLMPMRIGAAELAATLEAWVVEQPEPGSPRGLTRLLRALYDPEALERG